MKHTYSAGGIVINPEGQVLVVSQHGTSWSLPKGTLEKGEDHKTAALREIKEETGIAKVRFIKELGTYDRNKISVDGGDDSSELKTITMFLYTTSEESLNPIDPHNPEARWVKPDKVSNLLTHAKDKAFYTNVQDEVVRFIKTWTGNT
ncbi:MAG TPA: NUDIX domain-containing protein [Candidatus Saccharimonadales bacterium]|nr:NUDIX domain-containing protein [Candidatus Saccharimonadales bacterium]